MNTHDSNDAAIVTAQGPTSDLYQHEMQLRLQEWNTRQLTPKLQGGQFVPLIMLTVMLPVICLIGAWFL